MKTGLVAPDGVGLRNFVLGRLLDLLACDGEVLVWHGFPPEAVEAFAPGARAGVRWALLPPFREGIAERLLRRAKLYAQLYWQRERGTVIQARGPARLLDRAIDAGADWLARACATGGGVRALDDAHRRFAERNPSLGEFIAVLERERPDCLFCTHQRAGRAVPALAAARRLGIPTATFIYSWDNLPKGRMAVHADHFLVWSEHMAAELRRYYPEVAPDRIHITGTPQFEFYSDRRFLEPRHEFLRAAGLDPGRPVLCFSGDDPATSPFDPLYLRDVAEAVRRLPAPRRPQILFRPCPADGAGRYRVVLAACPEVVLSDVAWLRVGEGDWTRLAPTAEDLRRLVNVAAHCDAVVNVGSTMALDFAINGNPALYLNYNPEGRPAGHWWDVRDIYRLPHFAPIHELQPVYWANTAAELPPLIDHVLRNRSEKEAARRECVRRLTAQPLEEASRRCAEALKQIAGRRVRICTSVS